MTHLILTPMRRPPAAPFEAAPIKLLNLAILGVFVAWLATACYALAYLISH